MLRELKRKLEDKLTSWVITMALWMYHKQLLETFKHGHPLVAGPLAAEYLKTRRWLRSLEEK